MATKAQLDALLGVPCSWCGARVGERCRVRIGRRLLAPTTLDGESHDARWLAALGSPARVLGQAVAELRGDGLRLSERRTAVREDREPVLVGAAIGDDERPW